MTRVIFRKEKRLTQLALLSCCAAFLIVGRLDGQTVNNQNQGQYPESQTDRQGSTQQSTSFPTVSPSRVLTIGSNETDISDPSTLDGSQYPYQNQDQNQNRDQYQNPNQYPYQNLNRNQTPGRTPNSVQPRVPTPPIAPVPLTEFQKVIRESTGRTFPIFGANLFGSVPSTFAPVDNIPVTPDYVIGPGDELRLQIWGQVNQRGTFIVDRTGSISLPEIGALHVAGLQFSQLSDFLKSQIGRVYRNYDLNVNLGQLRSIQVFVVGQARQPGSYTIGSLSTLLNALFASGGPLPQGSLRDIQVRRGSDTVTHFDLYDLLLRGDKSKDVRLQPGDVIFIPPVGPQVAVLGSVITPAIYELHGETTFSQAVAMAGGLTNVADGSKVRVDRVSDHAQRSALDINFNNGAAPAIQDGDIITVNSIVDRFQNAVTLRGNVANPGRYQWHAGMRVSDLIPSRDALVTRDYYQRRDRLAQNANDYKENTNQGSAMIRANPTVATGENRETGTTSGGGNSLGATLTGGSRSFSPTTDVLLSAPDIDWDYAVIERQSATDLTTSLVSFNLGKAINEKDKSQDLELLAGDVVTIFSTADVRVPNAHQTKFVKLEGEFAASGMYSVQPGETLRHLLERAGGITPDAYLYASEFSRESVRRVERQRIIEYADALESDISSRSAALASSAVTERDAAAAQQSAVEARTTLNRLRQAQPTGRIVFQIKPDSKDLSAIPDIQLEDGDRFVIPKQPATVAVQGQVYNANAFVYQKGKRAKDYLYLAGGADRNADRKREFILRADGSVVSYQYGSSLGKRVLFADNNFDNIVMLPGDTIVVPPNLEKGAIMRNLLNISTIISGLGLGAAAINVLK